MKPETRWKVVAVAAFLATVWLALSWWSTARELDKADAIIDKYAADELRRQDYDDGEYVEPDITDIPLGTKPILTAKGKVVYPPRPAIVTELNPVEEAWTATQPATVADVPHGNPCNLDDLTVTVDCDIAVLSTPTKPWSKLVASGTIEGWGQTRVLPPTPAGDINLEVTPAVVPPLWHLDFLGGLAVGERMGIEAGLAWTGKSRLGGYALAEWQPATGGTAYDAYRETTYSTGSPATWRIHGGLSFRLK